MILAIGAGCQAFPKISQFQRFEFSNPELGTIFTITLYTRNQNAAAAAAQAAFKKISALSEVLSNSGPNSELVRLYDHPSGQPVTVSQDLFNALKASLRASELSDGRFDVTAGPYAHIWQTALEKDVLPTSAQIAAAQSSVGWRKIHLDPKNRTVTLLAPDMGLNFEDIIKGIAVDQAMLELRHHGVFRAIVSGGGETAVGSPPPLGRGWKIEIPANDGSTNKLMRVVVLHNAGVSTFEGGEAFVEIGGVQYSRFVDPASGLGFTNRFQSTVIGPDATIANGLSAAVNSLGAVRGLALIDSLRHTAALITTRENGDVHTVASRRFRDVTELPASAEPEGITDN